MTTQAMLDFDRRVHPNSVTAYHEETRRMCRRAAAIYDAIGDRRLTDREIMALMGYSDMNAVRPRITEMVEDGILTEIGSKVCPLTGKTVRVVARRLI